MILELKVTIGVTPTVEKLLANDGASNRQLQELHINMEGMFSEQAAKLDSIGRILKEDRETTMATKQDAEQRLEALGGKLDKISGETTGLVQAIRELRQAADDAVAAGNTMPDSFMQKLDSLDEKANSIDEQVDDVAPNPTPTPEDSANPEAGPGAGEADIGKVEDI